MPADYLYGTPRNYMGKKGLIDVSLLELPCGERHEYAAAQGLPAYSRQGWEFCEDSGVSGIPNDMSAC